MKKIKELPDKYFDIGEKNWYKDAETPAKDRNGWYKPIRRRSTKPEDVG